MFDLKLETFSHFRNCENVKVMFQLVGRKSVRCSSRGNFKFVECETEKHRTNALVPERDDARINRPFDFDKTVKRDHRLAT